MVLFNGKTGTVDKNILLIFTAIGIAAILIFLVLKNKFFVVELNNQEIKIFENKQEKRFDWSEIEKLNQIQFIYPPLYKIKIKNNDKTILFNTSGRYISISGVTTDISEMGDLIKVKKKELGI